MVAYVAAQQVQFRPLRDGPAGADEEQGPLGGRTAQPPPHQQGRLVGPLEVVEDEDEGAGGAEAVDQDQQFLGRRGHRIAGDDPGAVPVAHALGRGAVRCRTCVGCGGSCRAGAGLGCGGGCRASVGLGSGAGGGVRAALRVGPVAAGAEHVAEGLLQNGQGQPPAQFVTDPVPDVEPALPAVGHTRRQQRTLPDAGLALDQDDTAPSGRDFVQQGRDQDQGALSPHQGARPAGMHDHESTRIYVRTGGPVEDVRHPGPGNLREPTGCSRPWPPGGSRSGDSARREAAYGMEFIRRAEQPASPSGPPGPSPEAASPSAGKDTKASTARPRPANRERGIVRREPSLPSTADLDRAAGDFVRLRERLFGLAYLVLGSTTEAEDVVREVWLRWREGFRSAAAEPEMFLLGAAARLAVDTGQAACARRASYIGPWLPEPVDTGTDPEAGARHTRALDPALLVVLDALGPAERAAYILRKIFGYGYPEIAGMLRLGPADARRAVGRARRRLPQV